MTNTREQDEQIVIVERHCFQPFKSREIESEWINFINSFRKVENRGYGDIPEDNNIKKKMLSYQACAKDIRKTDADYNFWVYISNILYYGITNGYEAYRSYLSNNIFNFYWVVNLCIIYLFNEQITETRLAIAIEMPFAILAASYPHIRMPSKNKIITLDDEKGSLLDVVLLKPELKEDITI